MGSGKEWYTSIYGNVLSAPFVHTVFRTFVVNKSIKFNDIEYSYNQPYGVEEKTKWNKNETCQWNALKKIQAGTKFTDNK